MIGQLRERITIKAPVVVSDGAGGYTAGTPTNLVARWSARVSPLNGRERLDADQTQGQTQFRVMMRHKAGVTTKHYVVWHERDGDRTLDITGIVNSDEKGRFLTLDCIERVP